MDYSRDPVPLPVIASSCRAAFPSALAREVDACLAAIPAHEFPPSYHLYGPVYLGGEVLRIPSRIYPQSPLADVVYKLGETQQLILACLLSRHHNGFERQRHVSQLLSASENWVPAYILQLVGEYVVEIIEVIAHHTSDLLNDRYFQFAADNPRFITLTKRRVISYWNEYYRYRFPRFVDYPGFKVLETLDLWDRREVRRFLAR